MHCVVFFVYIIILGLNFYGVKRVTGEPVPLARGLAMGEGQEITLPPGTTMAVKVS